MILVSSLASEAIAQQAPVGDHHVGRSADSGFGSGVVSPSGGLTLHIPLDLPSPRGDLHLPLAIVHTGGSRVGDVGVGWTVPFGFVSRPTTLTYRRPLLDAPANRADWRERRPAPRQQLFLSLGGAPMLMSPDGGGGFRPIIDAQDLLLTQHAGDFWLAEDGAGRLFRFERVAGLDDESLWLLTRITDRTRRNSIVLEYRTEPVAVAGGATLPELFLDRLLYDFGFQVLAPDGFIPTCPKHEVRLNYDRPYGDSEILGYSVESGGVRVRTKVLTRIEVLALDGNACGAAAVRLHEYEVGYEPDIDTGLPRLISVDLRGRSGTPEGDRRIPIARYRYGAATSVSQADADEGRVLRYVEAAAIPLSDGLGIGAEGLASMRRIGGGYDTRHVTRDLTGDGRPDLRVRGRGAGV